MDVKLLKIKDKSDLRNERVVISVLRDCNIGEYILFDTTYSDYQISNKLRHTYWFPDKKVQQGDKVILYTKEGEIKEKNNESGNTSHFFYWELNETVWNKNEDCAVLVNIKDYSVLES